MLFVTWLSRTTNMPLGDLILNALNKCGMEMTGSFCGDWQDGSLKVDRLTLGLLSSFWIMKTVQSPVIPKGGRGMESMHTFPPP